MKQVFDKLSRHWIGLLVMILVVFATPMLVLQSTGDIPFDPSDRDNIIAQEPDYVFIGNSMLETRIDKDELESLTGKPVILLVSGGSRSPSWWLELKNNVAASNLKNITAFIFFRDRELTSSKVSRTSILARSMARKSMSEEGELDRILELNKTSTDRMLDYVYGVYPILLYRPLAEQILSRLAATPLMVDLFSLSVLRIMDLEDETKYESKLEEFSKLKRDTNDVFDLGNMRRIAQGDQLFGDYASFKEQSDKSTLPLMINLAREAEIKLVFIRVQKRPSAVRIISQDDEDLAIYLHDLKEYLVRNNVGFYDFTGDPNIPSEYYLEGDHIAPEYMPAYTRNFADRLTKYFVK